MAEFKAFRAGATEAEVDQFLGHLFANSSGIATDGVISGLVVAQTTTASASVLVGLGSAIVQDTLLSGAKALVSNAQKTLDILTANPMGALPRNDIVVFDSATSSIRNIVGTPNASPTDPSVPATAVKLARLRHAASATTVPTAKIDDLRVFTGLAQSVKPAGRWYVSAALSLTSGANAMATVTTDYTVGQAISAGALSWIRQIPMTGMYRVRAQVVFAGEDTVGHRWTQIRKNITGTDLTTGTVLAWGGSGGVSATEAEFVAAEWVGPLVAGDTIAWCGNQNSGGSLLCLTGDPYYTFMEITYLGPSA